MAAVPIEIKADAHTKNGGGLHGNKGGCQHAKWRRSSLKQTSVPTVKMAAAASRFLSRNFRPLPVPLSGAGRVASGASVATGVASGAMSDTWSSIQAHKKQLDSLRERLRRRRKRDPLGAAGGGRKGLMIGGRG